MIEKIGNNLGNALSLNGGGEAWSGISRIATSAPTIADVGNPVSGAVEAHQLPALQMPNLHLHQHQHHHHHNHLQINTMAPQQPSTPHHVMPVSRALQ